MRVPPVVAPANEKIARQTADMAVAQAQAKAAAQMRRYEKDNNIAFQQHVRDNSSPVHLSPQQLFVDMKNLMEQQKAASRTDVAGNVVPIDLVNGKKVPEMNAMADTNSADSSAAAAAAASAANVDVDSATFQLAGAKIDERNAEQNAQSHPIQENASAFDAASMLTSSREMDVSNAMMTNMSAQSSDLGISLNMGTDEHSLMSARKKRADDIDKVLNSAGNVPTTGAQSQYSLPQSNSQHAFDALRLGNSRLSGSVSRSFSFLKMGVPFASRENSMEFRRNSIFSGKRDMSIEMMKRDVSMDLIASKRMGSHDLLPDSELPRDMSLDCFGGALRGANRDFSMEMQIPQGSRLELGALTDDVVFGLSNVSASPPVTTESQRDPGTAMSDSRIYRSKFGKSSDDLTGHMLGNTNHQQPYYRRAINGSIEDFREIRLPF